MKTITGITDIDRLILEKLDDKTLWEIRKINKFFLREVEKVFETKMRNLYPFLAKKKPFLLHWTKYYLENKYYINYIRRYFKVNFIVQTPYFNPAALYRTIQNDERDFLEVEIDRYAYLAECYAETGNKEQILWFLTKVEEIESFDYDTFLETDLKQYVLGFLLKNKNISLYEELRKEWNFQHTDDIYCAAQSGDFVIVDYVIENIALNYHLPISAVLDDGFAGAALNGDIEMIEHLTKQFNYPVPLFDIFLGAIHGCQKEFLKNIIVYSSSSCEIRTIIKENLSLALFNYLEGRCCCDSLTQSQACDVVKFVVETLKSLSVTRKEFFKYIAMKPKKLFKDKEIDPMLLKIIKNF